MAQYLCLVTVISNVDGGNRPDNTLPMPQPPQPPLGIWGPTDPRPGWGLPGQQPRQPRWASGVRPALPRPGLPGSQPYPDQGLPRPPGRPTHPIYDPPYPSPGPAAVPGQIPIYIPPAGGEPPLGIWGPTDPRPGYGLPGEQPKPSHPIVLPPDLPPETPEGRPDRVEDRLDAGDRLGGGWHSAGAAPNPVI